MTAIIPSAWPPICAPHLDPISNLKGLLTYTSVSKYEFLAVAREVYGDPLVDLLCENSKLTDRWPERIGKRHMQILLLALGHALAVDDIDNMKGQIREQFPHLQGKKVKDLSAEELDAICHKFRNPELLFGGGSFWEELQPHFPSISGPEKRSMALARQDYAMRQIFLHGQPQSPEFAFAIGEFLAKLAAYTKPETVRKGMLMPVYEEGQIVYYALYKQMHKNGLHAYFYVPLHNPESSAILLFRGTNGMQSAARSLGKGIGKLVFEENKRKLLRWVSEYAERSQNPSLRLAGHSLGALDSQRMLVSIVSELGESPDSPLKKFTKIAMEYYCSPKMDEETVKQWRCARVIFKSLPQKPKIKMFRAEHSSDILTWAGDFSLDHDDEDRTVDSSLMLVSTSRLLPNPHQAHSLSFFNPAGRFDAQGDRNFVLIKAPDSVPGGEEEDEGVIVISKELIEKLAEYFSQLEQLQSSQVGARQRSRFVRVLSEYALDPTITAVAVSASLVSRLARYIPRWTSVPA